MTMLERFVSALPMLLFAAWLLLFKPGEMVTLAAAGVAMALVFALSSHFQSKHKRESSTH